MNANETEHQRCPNCGAVIAERSESEYLGYCPRCVMERALNPSESEVGFSDLADTLTHSPASEAYESDDGESNDVEELAPGSEFGEFRIVRTLGKGGMGIVYEADHTPTSRRLALKVMSHALEDRQARARFLREGRLAASVNHPNSVYVYGTAEIRDRPAISMELVRGGTLAEQIRSKGAMDSKSAVDAILQIVDGLEAAHEVGILHRDIKPNNCFVDQQGNVKVGDFGLSISHTGQHGALIASQGRTQTEITHAGTFLGTPAYCSPEQLRGEPLDLRSDIYSVGVTLFFLVTGRVPFPAENMVQLLAKVLDCQPPSASELNDNVSKDLDSVIRRCLSKSPGERFESYAALRQTLQPHSSRQTAAASLGSRFLAAGLDWTILVFLLFPLSYFMTDTRGLSPTDDPFPTLGSSITWFIGLFIQLAWFVVFERMFGFTPGKFLMGLRVVGIDRQPSSIQLSTRAAIFVLTPLVPVVLFGWYSDWYQFEPTSSQTNWIPMLAGLSRILLLMGLFMMARERNGFLGIHEWFSGTRTVYRPSASKLSAGTVRSGERRLTDDFDPMASQSCLGPFHVLRKLTTTNEGELWLGYDPELMRRVWIHTRPFDEKEPDSPIEQFLDRQTRLRWLGGACEATPIAALQSEQENTKHSDSASNNHEQMVRWDAYEALSGQPFLNDLEDHQSWDRCKQYFWELAKEVREAEGKNDLPSRISLASLWITSQGHPKILPFQWNPPEDALDFRQRPVVETQEFESGLEITQRVASLLRSKFAPGGQSARPISLSDLEDLKQFSDASRSADYPGIAERIARRMTPNLKARTRGLVLSSFVVSQISVASLVCMMLISNRQADARPELKELAEALHVMDIERRLNGQEHRVNTKEVRNFIRANFEDLYLDDQAMYSMYGQNQFMRFRSELDQIFSVPLAQ